MIYAVITAFVLVYAGTLYFVYNLIQVMQKERELLLDRVQAQNLLEYKNLTEPVELKEKEDKPNYEFV